MGMFGKRGWGVIRPSQRRIICLSPWCLEVVDDVSRAVGDSPKLGDGAGGVDLDTAAKDLLRVGALAHGV